MFKFPLLILLALTPACVSTFESGTEFDSSKATKLVLNESTRGDVEKLFGQPSQTAATVTGLVIWNYAHMATSANRRGSTKSTVQQMQIHMRDGVVVDYFVHRM